MSAFLHHVSSELVPLHFQYTWLRRSIVLFPKPHHCVFHQASPRLRSRLAPVWPGRIRSDGLAYVCVTAFRRSSGQFGAAPIPRCANSWFRRMDGFFKVLLHLCSSGCSQYAHLPVMHSYVGIGRICSSCLPEVFPCCSHLFTVVYNAHKACDHG